MRAITPKKLDAPWSTSIVTFNIPIFGIRFKLRNVALQNLFVLHFEILEKSKN